MCESTHLINCTVCVCVLRSLTAWMAKQRFCPQQSVCVWYYREELGQQCCYDSNEQYTTDNKPAGSADYRFPLDNYLLHQSSDYFPYKACCIDSNDTTFCDLYYQVRPKGDSNCQPVVTMTGK